jgi:putative oxidoreductase
LIVPGLAGLYNAGRCIAYPLIRATIGLFLMPHGAQKLFGMFGGQGIGGTGEFFGTQLGLDPGWLWALLVGLVEFFGGLALVLGFLTRPAAAAVAVLMAVIMFRVHLPNGYFWNNGGYEYPLMWGLVALAVFFKGGGEMSIDRKIGREF